jgi:hypothetical protein
VKEAVIGGKRERSGDDRQAVQVFNQLTEAASTLMDAGELNIYSTSREVKIYCTLAEFAGPLSYEKRRDEMEGEG